jgi:SAM-dependent methyltransferase
VTAHGPEHSHWYVERFRRMAADGADLAGEARMVDALVPVRSRVLDAGCGPGRVGAELHARGHTVVGVDIDPVLIAAAVEDHPGPTWLVGDLATLDVTGTEGYQPFDGAVVAGNVLPYLAPGTGAQVLTALARHLRADAPIAVGFGLDRGYSLDAFDADAQLAGLRLENRFATWDLRAWTPHSPFAVTVLRTPAAA